MKEPRYNRWFYYGWLFQFFKELRTVVYTKFDYLNCFEIHGCDVAKKKEYMNFNYICP